MGISEPLLPRARREIAALPPYRQGSQANADQFKLSSNENPFAPLPSVLAAMRSFTAINRYPDATAAKLRARLARRQEVDPDCVLIGAGSVSLLAAFIRSVAGSGDEVIFAWRSFEAYPSLVAVAGATSVQVPTLVDGGHDLQSMAAAITEKTRCIIICSPNNPTGPAVQSVHLRRFLEDVPPDVLVLLDEAYAEFVTADGAINGLDERLFETHTNVVILRTFSKAYGLAALRIGYAIGHPSLIQTARSAAIPLAVTAQAELAALASLDHEDELFSRVREIVLRRDELVFGLRRLGYEIPDAQGNFIWLPETRDAVLAEFEYAGLVVRAFAEGIRISVGEKESVEQIFRVARRLRRQDNLARFAVE